MSKKSIVAVVIVIGVIYLIWDGHNKSSNSNTGPVHSERNFTTEMEVDGGYTVVPEYDYTVPANAVPNPSWSDNSGTLCIICHGDGVCGFCEGSGRYEFYPDWAGNSCRTCGGSGKCRTCGGSGWID